MDVSILNPIVLEILKKRGISKPDDIEEFINEKPKLTYDPFLLPNMREGVDFVLNAVKGNRKICIYGDYDVDGITATALLYNFLSQLSDKITYFIPSRFEEGYGLNNEALTQLKNDGVDTVITVDCGAVSKKEVAHGKNIGLDILVTDHHNMEEETAPECLVINPKHFNSDYPFSELCGCGVAFKLVQAIVRTEGLDKENLVTPLDLVAIATVADVVPLVDENRTLLKYGLRELNKGRRKALRIMANKLDITPGSIDSYKIGFIIGPHMNAAGRIKDENDVVKLLISHDNQEINHIVDTLIEHNNDRRAVQERCFDESVDIIETQHGEQPFLIIKPESIHEGIAGIVAGKIKEKYNKPSIVLSPSENESGETVLKGSGRSIDGINLIDMLLSHGELFSKLGGHAMAAGFSMPEENEASLRQVLLEDMNELLKENSSILTRRIHEDASIEHSDVSMELVNSTKLLAPFGVGNPRPVFKLADIEINNLQYMGGEKQHVKFNTGNWDAVLFGRAQEYKEVLESGRKLIIYGNPDVNSWNGREKIQFIIKEITYQEVANC